MALKETYHSAGEAGGGTEGAIVGGRHRAQGDPRARGRGRRPGRGLFALVVGLLLVATVGVAGVAGVRVPGLVDRACSTTPQLRVVAAPEIAGVVRDVAGDLARADDRSCRSVAVQSEPPVEVAGRLGTPSGGSAVDVWIPDSTQWLLTARESTKRPDDLPESGASVARSPVVLALPEPVAQRMGVTTGAVPWARVAAVAAAASAPVQLALPAPDENPVSTSALIGLRGLAGQGEAGRDRLVALLRQLRKDVAGDPRTRLQAVAASATTKPIAAPVSEQAMWAYNRGGSAARVAASYVANAPALDYPFLVLTHAPQAQALAERLRKSLTGPGGAARLQAVGFRTAGGAAGRALTASLGLDPRQPARGALAEGALLQETLRTFDAVTQESRLLAVLDVSGSMAVRVPGAGGATRMDITKAAATKGLALFPPGSEIGLWEFSTDLTPKTDYRQLVSLGRLDAKVGPISRRAALAKALGSVQPVLGGATGLYDTTLAAVRTMRATWSPGHANTVLLFTDGRNEDSSSISLARLVQTLRKENDPRRPVPVITIGFGPDIDVKALQAVADATQGKVYRANNPAEIQRVFLDAISLRACRPDC